MIDDRTAARLALEAAIREARADTRPKVPHEQVMARLAEMLAEAEARIEQLAREDRARAG